MAKKCTFDEIITVEDEDGDEYDIEVTIYYSPEAPDPEVGYAGGMEEFGFESSEHAVFNVKWLEDKLNSDEHFADWIRDLILADMGGLSYEDPDDFSDDK